MKSESVAQRAQVIARSTRDVIVRGSDGSIRRCEFHGALRRGGSGSPLVVGDIVEIAPLGDEAARIERVLPRRNQLSRAKSAGGGRELVLAANVDLVAIVLAAAQPRPRLEAVDRILVAAESQELPAAIFINKIDLEVSPALDARLGVFTALGYPVMRLSLKDDTGVDAAARLLAGKAAVVTGPSGVGKTTLLNRLVPGLDLKVGEISEHNEKGRHTTSQVTWHPAPGGGALIDTPGFREYGLWGLGPLDVAAAMVEFRPYLGQCRFTDCRHGNEPKCAIRSAVDSGAIDRRRYRSYLHILDMGEPEPWDDEGEEA